MVDAKRIWVDGKIVDYQDATTHILSHSLHYGLGVFEGIRAYQGPNGSSIFRLPEHVDRLFASARAATIEIPFTKAQIVEAIIEVLRENGLQDAYIRPLVWLGEGSVGIAAADNAVRVAIAAWKWGTYLGEAALEAGIRCCISSYRRNGIASSLEKAKICGQYVNSVLAKRDAKLAGFEEAILLDEQGYVTEGSGENLFIVRDGVLVTPSRGGSILAGITRDTILALASDLAIETRQEPLTRSELFFSDEIFLTGTAAEVTPVREIDGRIIGRGRRGPVTEAIQMAYFQTVRGENARRPEWLTNF